MFCREENLVIKKCDYNGAFGNYYGGRSISIDLEIRLQAVPWESLLGRFVGHPDISTRSTKLPHLPVIQQEQ